MRSRKWARRRRKPWWPRGYVYKGERCGCGAPVHFVKNCYKCGGTGKYRDGWGEQICRCWYCPKEGSFDWDTAWPRGAMVSAPGS